ncbi:MAG: hypothetical protein KDK39_19245 [Leptospiraceae bacterium]|nr:hypothetical protein [Leptospiraceae bacterium]
MRKNLLFLAALLSLGWTSVLFAFHPIRYNPLDRYVLSAVPGGPKGMVISDKAGKKGQSARLEYNSQGQLTKEIYFDTAGKKEGESRLTYLDGRLSKEELYNAAGQLLNRRVFEYTGKELVKMKVYNAKGESELEQIYQYRREFLTGGQENNGAGFLSFSISYDNGLASTIKIHNDENLLVSMIYLKYDANGRVVERVRSQGGQKHRFVYTWQDDRILAYKLLQEVKGQWELQRSITFQY